MVLRLTRPEDLISQGESISPHNSEMMNRDRHADTSTGEQNTKNSNQDDVTSSTAATSNGIQTSTPRRPEHALITSYSGGDIGYKGDPPPAYTEHPDGGYPSRRTEVIEMSEAIHQPRHVAHEGRTQDSEVPVSHNHNHNHNHDTQQSSLTDTVKKTALACLVPCSCCLTGVGSSVGVCAKTRCCTQNLVRWGR